MKIYFILILIKLFSFDFLIFELSYHGNDFSFSFFDQVSLVFSLFHFYFDIILFDKKIMAEVHIIGQLLEAEDFTDRSLFVKWSINAGSCWTLLEGFNEGQTALSIVSTLNDSSNDDIKHPWSHPIDVHYLTKGLHGWPKIELHVWGVDWLGKCNISAYGFINIPMKPGFHELSCCTWRPVGDLRRRFIDYITGYRMHLVDPSDIISNGLNRHVIQSMSMGTIKLELNVVLKGFDKYGIEA